VDDHRNAEVRGILSPLKKMAERLNVAVVLLSHLSKGGSANPQQRVIGSIAYVGACRANFLFVKDREDPTGRRVLMLDNGGNLAQPAPTLAYSIDDRGDGPRVEWLEDSLPITAEEALAADQAACQAVVAAPERREAETWLTDVLSSGPVPAKEVEAAARDAAIARMTLRRAKERLGVVSLRAGFGRDSTCSWRLAEPPGQ
jgi:putative DNA primase/helicase